MSRYFTFGLWINRSSPHITSCRPQLLKPCRVVSQRHFSNLFHLHPLKLKQQINLKWNAFRHLWNMATQYKHCTGEERYELESLSHKHQNVTCCLKTSQTTQRHTKSPTSRTLFFPYYYWFFLHHNSPGFNHDIDIIKCIDWYAIYISIISRSWCIFIALSYAKRECCRWHIIH